MRAPAGWYDDGSGHPRWWNGSEWADAEPAARTEVEPPSGRGRLSPRTKSLLSAAGAVVAVAVVLVIVAFTTPRHWAMVDVAEHLETFHTEEYETGLFVVEDDHVSPCYEGQDWFDCRDRLSAEHSRVCVDTELTPESIALCEDYKLQVDRMELTGDFRSSVVLAGDYGSLASTAEVAARMVSNGDFRPAVTHDAVCYLGFLGECRQPPLPGARDGESAPSSSPTPRKPSNDDAVVRQPPVSDDPTVRSEPVTDEEVAQEISNAVEVVGTFWMMHYADFFGDDRDYVPPTIGGLYASDDLPFCGDEQLSPENAFYCPVDHTLWWDARLMREFYSAGDANVYLIVGHEWGHAIQAQSDRVWNGEELQADCLAAAALFGASEDDLRYWDATDTREVANALTELADDTRWTDSSDHGDALDRIDAFNDGRDGVEGCFPIG